MDEAIARRVDVRVFIGEVCLAPLETSAYGRILFERVSIPGFGAARRLWVKLRSAR